MQHCSADWWNRVCMPHTHAHTQTDRRRSIMYTTVSRQCVCVLLSGGHSVVSGRWSESLATSLHHKRTTTTSWSLCSLTAWPRDHLTTRSLSPQYASFSRVLRPRIQQSQVSTGAFQRDVSSTRISNTNTSIISSSFPVGFFLLRFKQHTCGRLLADTIICVNNESTRRAQTTARASPVNLR